MPTRLFQIISLMALACRLPFIAAVVLSYGSVHPCSAAPTSLGPTSPEEAEILWRDGQRASQESRHQDTINQLGRYVDRYPGEPGFLEAHFILGKAYFELKRTPEALKTFQYYVHSKGMTPAAAEARVWMGRSYLLLGKNHEALQVSLELEQIQAQLPPEITLWKLLIQARAYVNMKNETSARNAVEVAEHEISATTPPNLKGQIYALKLQVKAMSCAHLQSSVPLDETQALSLMDRRGTCMLETLLIFNKALKTENPPAVTEAAVHLNRAFEAYRIACHRAPPPKPIADHKRTPEEFKSYRDELGDLLSKNYRGNSLQALELLNSWKPPAGSPVFDSYLLVSSYLKKTTSRNPQETLRTP